MTEETAEMTAAPATAGPTYQNHEQNQKRKECQSPAATLGFRLI